MSVKSTIALDAMGGDYGPSVTVPAAIMALEESQELRLILVGDENLLAAALRSIPENLKNRVSVQHASQRVEMDDEPSKVLRNKKDSSMRVAINLVRDGIAGACVSAGNTGALMATARFVLKMIPGIDRPAIIATLPSIRGHTYVLDLGANVECTAEHLFQFAVMANELVKAVEDLDRPKIGLLNIGSEEIKGNDQVKKASKLLSDADFNFVGFSEGDDVCAGDVDIVVTDGFVGNVALKSAEGVAKMISHEIKQAFSRNLLTKLTALIARPVLKSVKNRIDPRLYNGASLLGLRGIVIKSHGGADALAFANAIKTARLEAEQAVIEKIGARVEKIFSERKTA
ncbi:MAG: phosphate acyltransferase PlsX [Methylococcaceae bacterium]|nr:phosphate acyltransferase PlsX [Methylococcaceae bacterium]MCI0666808.1 phosphate acyltransferase PlsX [Methylococcaceae bacterium]